MRKRTGRLICSGYMALALVTACGSTPMPDTGASNSSIDASVLHQDVSVAAPIFEVGDSVNFVSEIGISERTVISAAGTSRTYRVVEGDGDVWIQHYDGNSNRYLSEREDGSKRIEVSPSTLKYAFPLFVGKSWSGSFRTTVSIPDGDQSKVLEQYTTDVSCEVLCIEMFEAPAGRFETFKISCELDRSDRIFDDRQTYWYSPAIGANMRNEFVRADTDRLYDWYEMHGYSRAHTVEFDVLPDGIESTCSATISMNEPGALTYD